MRLGTRFATVVATTLLVQLAAAHGNEMDMHSSPAPIESGDMPDTYFRHGGRAAWMIYTHAAMLTVAWMFILPIVVMLSIARSKYQMPLETVFAVVNGVGTLAATIYRSQVPDLYPNNAHHKIGWILNFVMIVHTVALLTRKFAISQQDKPVAYQRLAFLPDITADNLEAQAKETRRFSGDSGQGSDQFTSPTSPEQQIQIDDLEDVTGTMDEKADFEDEYFSPVDRFIASKVPKIRSTKIAKVVNTVYLVLDRIRIPFGFIAFLTGIVTFSGIFQGIAVFNGLAHFIKGGIFFGYGVLTLGRWLGCFAEVGWAWNVNPNLHPWVPSAEFVESFVIFFYGSVNVFLEHLAAADGEWAPMDLEHVSISIMFFGGGLFGMFVESKAIRQFLNAPLLILTSNAPLSTSTGSDAAGLRKEPDYFKSSTNPLPALIIFILGIMMSGHSQETMVSTMIHRFWGQLLSGFALARMVTYVLTVLKPPKSIIPSRPPSELISAFCLMSGGMIFMASNRDTTLAMERWNLDAMFVFTVTMGWTAFLMAFITFAVALKGMVLRKGAKSARNRRGWGSIAGQTME